MTPFKEANQAKTSLKMILSNYSWYQGIEVLPEEGGYCIVVSVSRMDNSVRKIVPIVHQGITVKVDVEQKQNKL